MGDSYNPIRCQAFVVTAAGAIYDLSAYFQGLTINTGIGSAWNGSIKLTDTDDALEEIIFALGSTGTLKLRFGDQSSFDQSPMYECRVLEPDPTFGLNSTSYTMSFISKPAQLALEMPVRGGGAYREGMLVGDIARKIAKDNGWATSRRIGGADVDTIEPGLPIGRVLNYFQESPWAFLANAVLPLATNGAGNHFNMFMDTDNVFHFHSPGYLTGNAVQRAVRTFRFGAGYDGDVISFTPSDLSAYVAALGGAGAGTYTFVDTLKGQQKTLDSAQMPRTPHTADETGRKPIRTDAGKQTEPVISTMIASRDGQEAAQMAQARNSFLSSFFAKGALNVKGQHGIHLDDLIEIIRYNRNGTTHHTSGLYRVTNVEHEVSGTWTTDIQCYRSGSQYKSNQQQDTKTDTMTSPSRQSAPAETPRRATQ